MPIYEYQCAKCKKVHEIWQKITEPNATKCPSCGGKIERLISASGFALKGTGWYKTDYERKGKTGGGGETTSHSSDSSSSSDSTGGDDSSSKAAKGDGDKKKKKDAGASDKRKGAEGGGGSGSDKKAQAA